MQSANTFLRLLALEPHALCLEGLSGCTNELCSTCHVVLSDAGFGMSMTLPHSGVWVGAEAT